MRINYDFTDLEAFLAVMETASFHHAAERLNLSQSAITRRIQKLEEVLGSPLFERTTRLVKPTLAAKRLFPRAEAILDGAEEATRAMRDESVAFSHQRNAVVTLAMIPTLIVPLLLPALRLVQAKGLDPRVRVLDYAANQVAEAVAQGDADFGVCSAGVAEPNTLFEPLFEDEIAVAIPPDHRFAGREHVLWSDLHHEPLILPARGTGNRLLIDDAMAENRLSAAWTYEVGRTTTAMELAREGLGLALLPRTGMYSGIGKQLDFKNLRSPTVKRPVGLLSRISGSDSPTVSELKTALHTCADNLKRRP